MLFENAIYMTEPEVITYMQLPTGEADVWLRKNIEQEDFSGMTVAELKAYAEENNMELSATTKAAIITELTAKTGWTCDEVYLRTSLSYEEIEENFDTIFENEGEIVDKDTGEEVADGITLAERVEILEAALIEIGGLL